MTAPQHKIGSGFGWHTTTDEVLAGLDLTGKLAIVTGGYSGIGTETTRALVNAGALVVVPARRPENAEAEIGDIAEVRELDLGDLDSVDAFADDFLATGRAIDIMINSAGIMACPETRVGAGWEAQFATNHLGHFALVNRLWPAIGPDARVVSVSSRGHHFSGIRWDDVHFARGYDKWLAYGQAKTANVLFARQLDKLGRDAGVRAFAVHPGGIRTALSRHLDVQEMIDRGYYDKDGNSLFTYKTPQQGAATQVWAATSPRLAGMGGVYLEDCDVAEVVAGSDATTGVDPHAIDPEQAERLWTLSAELTGVDAFAAQPI
jgi:NAD(P)-dependent dehydrogenase (short-subunit alcohol dehydrogenase family)